MDFQFDSLPSNAFRPTFGTRSYPGLGAILHERAASYYAEGSGALSIKCMFGGQAVYETGGRRLALGGARYLLLNDDQPYTIQIESRAPVESFCVFFDCELAYDVLRSLIIPSDRLLDLPRSSDSPPVRFFDQLYPHDDLLTPRLLALRAGLQDGLLDSTAIEERFYLLLEAMLQVHRDIYQQVEKFPAARWSTRVELYRRLRHAIDYMESYLDQPITLAEIAGAACLSPHHFLRLFKRAVGETPHQYLIRRRLERAQSLLMHTRRTVTEICLEVGFESPSSFSLLFRSRFGVSPQAVRKQARR